MDYHLPGEGILAIAGVVTAVTHAESKWTPRICVEGAQARNTSVDTKTIVWPQSVLAGAGRSSWRQGDEEAGHRQRRHSCLFPSNQWVFRVALACRSDDGTGMAAVYKHIPEYFPEEVGVGRLGRRDGRLADSSPFSSDTC